jgi:hypothetical protein
VSPPSLPGPSATSARGEPETVLLDACVAINLYASRHFDEILSDLPYRFAAAETVSTDETLFVRRGGDDDDPPEAEPLKLDPSISSGSLQWRRTVGNPGGWTTDLLVRGHETSRPADSKSPGGRSISG